MKARICVVLVSGLLASVGALPTTAQPAQSSAAPAVKAMTAHELAQMLTSPSAAEREEAFYQITNLAYRSPEVDLTPTIPVLTDIITNDPDERDRLTAVSALCAIGDESGMQRVRQRFTEEPSLVVQYVSVGALLDYYGPDAFENDAEARALAKNVLARKREAGRLAVRHRLHLWPRVLVGPLEVVPDSLR